MEAETDQYPLDARWVLQVAGRIYGPYTGHALKEYAREGRVVPHSIVARTGSPAGEETWMPAAEDPVLGILFQPGGMTQPMGQPAAQPSVQPSVQPATQPVLHPAPEQTPAATTPAAGKPAPSYGPRKNQIDRRAKPTSFNILIVADVKSRSSGPMETALMSLGPAYKVSANSWVVHTPSGAPEVVNLLTQHLGSSDRLFVVDATRNRTAWYNMGPETEAKIRQVWKQG